MDELTDIYDNLSKNMLDFKINITDLVVKDNNIIGVNNNYGTFIP